MTKKRRKYEQGDTIGIRIPLNIDEKILDWINGQKNISGTILEIAEQYISGKLLSIDVVAQMIATAVLKIQNEKQDNDYVENEDIKDYSEHVKDINKNIEDVEDAKEEDDFTGFDIIPNKRFTKINEAEEEIIENKNNESSIIVPNKKMPFKATGITKSLINNDN